MEILTTLALVAASFGLALLLQFVLLKLVLWALHTNSARR